MNVAFIVNQFPCISETFILRQITGLLERGHVVEIFAYSPGKDTIIHGDVTKYDLLKRTTYLTSCTSSQVKLVRFITRLALLTRTFHRDPLAIIRTLNVLHFGRRAVLLQILSQIAPFLNKGPYDVVHCHFGQNGDLGLLLKDTGFVRGKVITTFYGYDVSLYLKQLGDNVYRDLFRKGDLLLCVSDHMRRKLASLGCDDRKLRVHKLGLEMKAIDLRQSSSDDRLNILTIARFVEKKGLAYGIQAVAKVIQKYPKVDYYIAGDGPLKNELQCLIEKLQISSNVHLLGAQPQDQVLQLLRESDVFLAPSVTGNDGDEEGIPTTIVEAFAHGLPVISTMHSGIPEIVQNGESGFLVPERDVDALAEKIEYLIERPQLREAMGHKGRRFVQEHHDIDKLNDQLTKLYSESVTFDW